MIVHSVRQLARHLGKSHTMLNRDLSRGKFRQEPGGGFDVEKVRATLARSGDPSQAPRRDTALTDELGMSGSAYEIFNRARAAKELTIAKERQLNIRNSSRRSLQASPCRSSRRHWRPGTLRAPLMNARSAARVPTQVRAGASRMVPL